MEVSAVLASFKERDVGGDAEDQDPKDGTKGFKPLGTGCERVDIPANAELDYTEKDWTCKRGFK